MLIVNAHHRQRRHCCCWRSSSTLIVDAWLVVNASVAVNARRRRSHINQGSSSTHRGYHQQPVIPEISLASLVPQTSPKHKGVCVKSQYWLLPRIFLGSHISPLEIPPCTWQGKILRDTSVAGSANWGAGGTLQGLGPCWEVVLFTVQKRSFPPTLRRPPVNGWIERLEPAGRGGISKAETKKRGKSLAKFFFYFARTRAYYFEILNNPFIYVVW